MADYFKAMKLLPTKLKREMRKALLEIGHEFQDDAKKRAEFSRQIPGAIKVTVTQHGVWVYTKKGVRVAELNEYYGNHKSARWRHPVYNKGGWGPGTNGSQKATAFLKPTYDSRSDYWFAKTISAVEKAFTSGGFSVK